MRRRRYGSICLDQTDERSNDDSPFLPLFLFPSVVVCRWNRTIQCRYLQRQQMKPSFKKSWREAVQEAREFQVRIHIRPVRVDVYRPW